MPDIFRKTRRDREEAAGLSEKPPEKKQEESSGMSQADFSYGYRKKEDSKRPPMSKKWTEK